MQGIDFTACGGGITCKYLRKEIAESETRFAQPGCWELNIAAHEG